MAEGTESSRQTGADVLGQLERRLKALETKSLKTLIPAGLDAALVTYKSGVTVNGTDPVTHNLKRPAQGYFVVGQDAAGSIYEDRGTPWTADRMFLKSSVAGVTYRLLVF